MSPQLQDDAPRQGLRQRLHNVADLLQLVADLRDGDKKSASRQKAAETDGNESNARSETSTTELLHDLRVACRRAETALKFCRRQLTSKESTWFRDQMRSIRKLCNPLRDDEVFRKWLRKQSLTDAGQELVKSVSDSIRDARKTVAAQAQDTIQRRHFRRHIHELWADEEASAGGDLSYRDQTRHAPLWCRQLGQWLFDMVNQMLEAISDDGDDFDALHQLRIAAKRLRYGLEYAAELDPQLTLRKSIGLLRNMQDKLGELHDAVVRLPRLESEFPETTEADELIAAARKDLQRCATAWQDWWRFTVLKQIVVQSGTEVTKLLIPSEQ